ncbi:hypothetical protein LOK49_LG14G02246 [Camellia lanceoleosa]|uniref:Uncharacterized protein n=1 Tax=Camellia lanceoleosa TaxID=1840588 RepID=A0ACC0F986_9ERIC|nr:hypothetical protein LOK49_LG14G02246 [Camellia lanceoleosa]
MIPYKLYSGRTVFRLIILGLGYAQHALDSSCSPVVDQGISVIVNLLDLTVCVAFMCVCSIGEVGYFNWLFGLQFTQDSPFCGLRRIDTQTL